MPKSEKGFAHVLILILLLIGVGVSVYLVTQKTNFFPHASELTSVSQPVTRTTCPKLPASYCQADERTISGGYSLSGCPRGEVCQAKSCTVLKAPEPKRNCEAEPILVNQCATRYSVRCLKVSPTPATNYCTVCNADVDKDGVVTQKDLGLLEACLGKKATEKDTKGNSCAPADIDRDGMVTILDVSCARNFMNQKCNTPAKR